MKKHFIFFSNCLPVYGYFGTTICDVQYGEYQWFSADLTKLIQSIDNRLTISEMVSLFDNDISGLKQFFDYFENRRLGFYTDYPEKYPRISKVWKYPSKITNCILDFDQSTNYNVENVINALETLMCRHIQFRFFYEVKRDKIYRLLEILKNSSILSIDIILSHSTNINVQDFKEFYDFNSRINSITIYNADSNYIVDELPFNISYIAKEIINETSCGSIHKNHFVVGIKLFNETFAQNNCLGQKIGVDRFGEIKNCPSTSISFGNVSNTNLIDVHERIINAQITKVLKTEIKTCSDCEFR